MADNVYIPSSRRRSIFSGLILMLIGGLFLIHNIRGAFPIWDIFERWWPLIFILWGVAKLYDRVVANRTGQVAPPTVTGGEIGLVFIVLLIVAAAAAFNRVGDQVGFNFNDFYIGDKDFSVSEDTPVQTLPANAQIYVRVARGDVTLHGEDASELRVTTRKVAQGSSQEQAQERANQVHVNVTQSGGSYTVQPSENVSDRRPVETDLEVHVPKGATVSVSTTRGTVEATNINGNISIEGRGGDISVRQAGGDVSVDAATTGGSHDVHVLGATGNVRISGRVNEVEVADVKGTASLDGSFFGSLRFERVAKGVRFLSQRTDMSVSELKGKIEIEGAGDMSISDVPGNVNLITNRRDITLENVAGTIHVENSKGGVTIRLAQPPKESVEVSSQSGDIEVMLPGKSSFDVEARSDRGEIQTEFGDESKISSANNNAALTDSIGSRGPKLQLRTTYGTIRIRKGP